MRKHTFLHLVFSQPAARGAGAAGGGGRCAGRGGGGQGAGADVGAGEPGVQLNCPAHPTGLSGPLCTDFIPVAGRATVGSITYVLKTHLDEP